MKKGFTLIELLIVVAIIGILAAIAVPNFINAQVRAKVARTLADLRSIRTSMEMYSLDNNRPIPDPNELAMSGIYQRGSRVWGSLTTPIAYISPSAFKDPFIPETPPQGNAAWEAVMDGVYHYRYVDFMRSVNNQGAVNNAFPGVRYIARSPGPDRWYIGDPQRLLHWFAYDPSNGVISVGDVIVTDMGILGESFQGQAEQ